MEVLENKLRRAAERQGLVLEKSRRRDARAKGFDQYRLLVDARDIDHHRLVTPFNLTLREVEERLTGDGYDEVEP
ncbi:MAG: hypothetical protein KYX69_11350 [Sphingomonas sp.]|uniref:hypothetical protein n=1 Tax=Sphingomonas sp. TaxID=28214 RepID=UPI0026170C84|nr:hypothetical protein [Sphingomonas sp.]MDK2768300.1 hypothetical protein [Sphingomonas sp.]